MLSKDIISKNYKQERIRRNKSKIIILSCLFLFLLILCFFSLLIGPSTLSFADSFMALFYQGERYAIKIVWGIRMREVLVGLLVGASLSIAGLIMQTTLGNIMASPSTLGISNAAVFGANLSIIIFAGGFVNTGNNLNNLLVSANPYLTSIFAFIFALLSTLLILGLSKIKNFSPTVIVLAGIALGSVFTAGTTLLQYFATDVGLSAAVIWSFGDLSRANYQDCIIIAVVLALGLIFYMSMRWKYNTLLGGDDFARSLGVKVNKLRFSSLLIASLLVATSISFVGLIGFIGIICPHIARKIFGNNHSYLIPSSFLTGSILLVASNTFGGLIGGGSALPVGAVTSIIGAPFFLYMILSQGGRHHVRN